MYCSSCGTALTQGLSYCNRCGVNLSIDKAEGASKMPGTSVDSIIWAIVVITIAVLGIMLGAIALMKEIGLSGELIISLAGLIFLTLVAIDGVFIWQLFRIKNPARAARRAYLQDQLDTKGLNAKREPSLMEPGISVTENTTRIFEPTLTGEKREENKN